jgi:hypothetical protein
MSVAACVIAACASNANRKQPEQNCPSFHLSDNYELYYKVNFKMFIKFKSLTLVKPVGVKEVGSIYAPLKTIEVRPFKTSSTTFAKAHCFSLLASKCPKGPDKYVKENLEQFTSSTVWQLYRDEIISSYLKYLEQEYSVRLTKESLDYDIEYIWEVAI